MCLNSQTSGKRSKTLSRGEVKHLKHVLCHLVTAMTSERVAALKNEKPLR